MERGSAGCVVAGISEVVAPDLGESEFVAVVVSEVVDSNIVVFDFVLFDESGLPEFVSELQMQSYSCTYII